ncbi:(Fe-S)-binding protein [Bacteroidota bacterium]
MYSCLECGRCTAVCPVSRTHNFSPRKTLSRSISKGPESMAADKTVWMCLTCKGCENVCPSGIPYAALNRKVRSISKQLGNEMTCTHGGVFEQINTLMTRPGIKQDRLDWVTDDIKVSTDKGDVLFYTGCSPYFAAYFGEGYDNHLLDSLRSTVKLMNKAGVEPQVLPNEICCGHDFLLRGEEDLFKQLATRVSKQIKDSKAKTVVFTCPECLTTLRDDYPKAVGSLGVELMHISQFLVENKDKLKFKENGIKATFQDPCRLGRYSGIYDQPREMLEEVPGFELSEMDHNKARAICCGNTAWVGCDAGTKKIQKMRLTEAVDTGSDTLLTSCPKCLIHLTCTQDGEKDSPIAGIKIKDTWEYLASCLE